MGICWSEPPATTPNVQSRPPVYLVEKQIPSAPPYYSPPQYPYQNPNYTYAAQQPYYQQPSMPVAYQQYPQQQRQLGTATAMLGGFVVGAMVEDMLDPTE
jgi:hypothetical protein